MSNREITEEAMVKTPQLSSPPQLSAMLHPETCSCLGASGRRAAIHELVGLFIKIIPTADPNELVTLFEQREKIYSTAIFDRVAIPFLEIPCIDQPVIAIANSDEGVDFGSSRGELTQLFIAVIAPRESPQVISQILARVIRLFRTLPTLSQQLIEAQTPQQLYDLFITIEDQ